MNPEKITSVYSGKNGKCCCGCSGKHYRDGPMVKKVVNIIQAHPEKMEQGTNHTAVVIGNRLYIAYEEKK